MHFICTAGGITTINECVAIYNSYKIDELIGTASKDSLGVKATLDFDINESNIINFKSVKKFNALAPGKVRYKTIAEDGHLDLIWNGNSLQIQNLKTILVIHILTMLRHLMVQFTFQKRPFLSY